MNCIERDISIKCEKRADAEEYSEYLIHYPFRRMRGRENEGVEQRFDSAECEDYHHTFPHLFLHLLSPVGWLRGVFMLKASPSLLLSFSQ